jgi:hypothetical protein
MHPRSGAGTRRCRPESAFLCRAEIHEEMQIAEFKESDVRSPVFPEIMPTD